MKELEKFLGTKSILGNIKKKKEPYIFVCFPHGGTVQGGVLKALEDCAVKYKVCKKPQFKGDMHYNWNCLWLECLEGREKYGYTDWCMFHSDVAADAYCVDTLKDLQIKYNADVISCVIPIKDPRGLTSTGLRELGPPPFKARRLTMKEIFTAPETFSIKDFPSKQNICLAVNNGLWMADITKILPGDTIPWADKMPPFQSVYTWHTSKDGKRMVNWHSEDWLHSGWFAEQGLRVFATRKIGIEHEGKIVYNNKSVWGIWETDPPSDDPRIDA
jgi:hypothetical protein